jgi:glycosyltransferase involved in cell wall biosynthesis
MKKIAIFQKDLNIGGIERSLINFLNCVDYSKYEIDLYLFQKDNTFIGSVNENVNIYYLDLLPSFTKVIKFGLVKKLYKCKVDKEYDIAIDYNSYSTDCALNAIMCKAKKRYIFVHNDIEIKLKEEPKYKILYNAFKSKYKYFDSFICVSKGARDAFKKVTGVEKEYLVIPNLIDTDKIKKQKDIKTDFTVDDKVINLCSTGRLVHQKGFDILIEEFSKVIEENNKYHLYIIGDGDEKENLSKLIDDLHMNEYVTLTGKYDNPFNIMNKCDAFVLTSRYEGQGMAILEGKALGLDIVIPRHLEKYLDDIEGFDSVKDGILALKKNKKKTFDDLKSYNDNIIKMINNL